MDTNIVTSDGIASAFHFISDCITITDDLCIAAISNLIVLAGNICVDIFILRICIFCICDFIPVAVCHCRVIRRPANSWHAAPGQGTGREGDGDDAG